MYRIIECLTQQHDYLLLAVATCVCIAGSLVTVLTLRRLLQATGNRKLVQLLLSSVIMGSTIWSTHFIAMLAYDPGVPHMYDLFLTIASFGVANFGAVIANALFAYRTTKHAFVSGGVCFGLTVSTMHFIGMSAYQIPGEIIWLDGYVIASIALGASIGIAAYHRILNPITRYCWLGGVVLMVSAISAMHFTGMSAFEIRLDSSIIVPPQLVPDSHLGVIILFVITFVLFVGFAAIGIETQLENDSLKQLQHTVTHDHLTGLPNRQHLLEHLETMSDLIFRDPTTNVAVLSIDLDLFKNVNDLYGHAVGDGVLIEVAKRLTGLIGPKHLAARMGGDEYVVVLADQKMSKDVINTAQRILDEIARPIYVNVPLQGKFIVNIGASIGIAVRSDGGLKPNDLLQESGLAMFRAKQGTAPRICQYDAEMDDKLRDETLMLEDLRNAAANDQFEVVYQLQNETGSRDIAGCEALLRWHHPERGTVSPVIFIPLAEKSGLIYDIGLWVLAAACREATSWPQNWSVAVNVAPQQLVQETFFEDLCTVLKQVGLPPHRLEIEITEASVINDRARTLQVLNQIKTLGVRIAMDDFGTGYSSLATLQAFPFDKIKIDRSFVTDLHTDARRAAIVQSTLSLGIAFDIPVLAEGVETEEELRYLASAGCNYVQGFYFGKPMSVEILNQVRNNQASLRAS